MDGVWSFQGGGQSSCRYFDRLCGKGNSMWSRGPSFNRTSPVHMPRGGTGRCSLGRGDDGSVHLVAKCGEEYCTASNSTLNSLLVWKTAQPCAAKRRLPPSRPAAQLCELAQPDDEQIMRARRTGQRWRCVCGGGLDGAGWPDGHTVEAYSHGHAHRPPPRLHTVHIHLTAGPWTDVLLAGIASAAAAQVCTATHCAAPRRRGPAQPARHDSTQNASLHARTAQGRQAHAQQP
jgi:hypothetical protein